MEALKAALRVVIADNFLFYFRSHSYHWNVEGIHFSQYHDFFGDIYEDVWGAQDQFVELRRRGGCCFDADRDEFLLRVRGCECSVDRFVQELDRCLRC